jgi:hypothetical protein
VSSRSCAWVLLASKEKQNTARTTGCRGLVMGQGVSEAIIEVDIADVIVATHEQESDAARARPRRANRSQTRRSTVRRPDALGMLFRPST